MSEPIPEYGGCAWPIDTACFTDEWAAISAPNRNRGMALASETLRRLTGYRVGGCPVTVRPCKKGCADGFAPYGAYQVGAGAFTPHLDGNGAWVNSCGCVTDCGCTALCEIKLPAPVGRIDEIKVDGVVLNVQDYRVFNGNLLVWTGTGECPWPTCQNLALPDTEVGTFSVTYLNAYPVDLLGAYAAGLLAFEFAKACSGAKCKLPSGVTSIVRQGITMQVATGLFPDGLTGIREVDAFIAIWNPNNLSRPASVWVPGQQSPRHQTAGYRGP